MQSKNQPESVFGCNLKAISQIIFRFTDLPDTLAAYQACHLFQDVIQTICRNALIVDFGISQDLIKQLQSPFTFYTRLVHMLETVNTRTNVALFIENCQSGDIDVLLLPEWFYPYSKETQEKFLKSLTSYSCNDKIKEIYLQNAIITGNLALIQLLTQEYKVTLKNNCDVSFALEGGHRKVAAYLIENDIGFGQQTIRDAYKNHQAGEFQISSLSYKKAFNALIINEPIKEGDSQKCTVKFVNVDDQGNTVKVILRNWMVPYPYRDRMQGAFHIWSKLPADELSASMGSIPVKQLKALIKLGYRPTQESANYALENGNICAADFLIKEHNLVPDVHWAKEWCAFLNNRHRPTILNRFLDFAHSLKP